MRWILLYGCETWSARVADERRMEVFDNDSIHRLRLRTISGTTASPTNTSKPSQLDQRRLRWFGPAARRPDGEQTKDPHRELEASSRRAQPQSRPNWSPSLDRDLKKSPMSSHMITEPGVPPSVPWSTRFVMPSQPTPGECRQKYK